MKDSSRKSKPASRHLPALVAVGGSLAALPAAALELGEITVHSRLGQPLRASIAYALGPNEQISDYCVAMRPGASLSGLPGIGTASIRVMNGVIMLAGRTVVREPMVSAHVVVNCPYSANLSREYMLFIDPVPNAYEAPVVTQQIDTAAEPLQVMPAAVAAAAIAPAAPAVPNTPLQKDLAAASTYTVRRGDSLSEITSRIKDRPVGLWAAVDTIFGANPDAFINNDPNQLKVGAVLTIPSFGSESPVVAVPETASPVYEAAASETSSESPNDSAAAFVPETGMDSEVLPVNDDLQAGNIILDDNPFVEPTATIENVVIPDTELAGPTTTSSNPNGSVAIIQPAAERSTSATPSWIFWLAGSGIALIIGLLLFGRRFRRDVEATPAAAIDATLNRRRSTDIDEDTDQVEIVAVDYDLTDESPTEENLVLDADLIIGSGLEGGDNDSVSEEFDFTAAAETGVELPFEPVAAIDEQTDILPPLPTDEHSILTSEVLPDDADDYDMSVIVDATKMPRPEDVTERDLKAVEVEPDDDTAISSNYTITREIDYRALERDYEDEFTATQALNKEIARAAEELAENLDEDDGGETMALPLASVTELDITAQMPAQNDDSSDPETTGVNEAITVNQSAEDATVEMPRKSGKK